MPLRGRSCARLAFILVASLLFIAACGKKEATPSATAVAPTPTPSPAAIVASASDRMQALKSLRFKMDVENGSLSLAPGVNTNSLEGETTRPDKLRLKAKATFANVVLDIELVSVGGNAYLRNPLTQQWQALPAGASPLEGADPFKVATVMREAKDLVRLGDEAISGNDTYHLGGSLAPPAVASVIGTVLQGEVIKGEVWIDKKEYLVRKLRLDFRKSAADAQGIISVLNLSDFDQPVTIEAPLP
ncbi:MAG: LppX_LprAFG lipoprotein [Chloroflexi bacterium]|nr:LppX_LprAFG lipoprotein [Chloroflexota bacterium]